jgi:DNA-binding phage protein
LPILPPPPLPLPSPPPSLHAEVDVVQYLTDALEESEAARKAAVQRVCEMRDALQEIGMMAAEADVSDTE